MPDSSTYPPVSFYFQVVFTDNGDSVDTSFSEVSGLSLEIGTEDVEEGGENRFVHKLPKAAKHGNLILKRGIAEMSSPLVTWCQSVLEGDMSSPVTSMVVMVYLMDEERFPIRAWMCDNAYPVKWEVDGFNSTKNEVAIETIELAYYSLSRVL